MNEWSGKFCTLFPKFLINYHYCHEILGSSSGTQCHGFGSSHFTTTLAYNKSEKIFLAGSAEAFVVCVHSRARQRNGKKLDGRICILRQSIEQFTTEGTGS